MTHTDTQLQQALAKMLPEKVMWNTSYEELTWFTTFPVLSTELLQLCWDVEEGLTSDNQDCEMNQNWRYYREELMDMHATWQQRVIALCKVKGVKIV